jgi:hypothetical protein
VGPSAYPCSFCLKFPITGVSKNRLDVDVQVREEAMDIGTPETEREIEISPVEEPVPLPAPVEEPVEEPVPA